MQNSYQGNEIGRGTKGGPKRTIGGDEHSEEKYREVAPGFLGQRACLLYMTYIEVHIFLHLY